MTLPASGAISIGMVAAELGIGFPLSLGDSRVRALAGVPSGPISMSSLYGKSAYTPMTISASDDSQNFDSNGAGGTASCSPGVTVTGGTGGYTYAWSFTSNPGGNTLTAANMADCVVSHAYGPNTTNSAYSVLQCEVTDSTGHTVVRGGIMATLNWAPGLT